MEYREWDMYDYILESKAAVRNIVENQDTIFEQALNYCKEKNLSRFIFWDLEPVITHL